MTKKSSQIRLTIGLGNEPTGTERLALWKQAALIAMQDPKLFNTWIRRVLDNAARTVLES